MNIILTPSLGLDGAFLLERFANTIDYPIKYKVAVNNGRPDALGEFSKLHPDWTIVSQGYNLGCAGSWNLFPKLFPNEASCLICNEDEELQSGALRLICEAADKHPDAPIVFVNDQDAYDMFVWTKSGRDQFGTFDENFWPAYWEDYEMTARFLARGGKPFRMTDNIPVKHGKPRPCSKAYHKAIAACGEMNQEYLKRKWGGNDEKPVFNYPFNDPSKWITDWKLEEENRAKREVIFYQWFHQATSIHE